MSPIEGVLRQKLVLRQKVVEKIEPDQVWMMRENGWFEEGVESGNDVAGDVKNRVNGVDECSKRFFRNYIKKSCDIYVNGDATGILDGGINALGNVERESFAAIDFAKNENNVCPFWNVRNGIEKMTFGEECGFRTKMPGFHSGDENRLKDMTRRSDIPRRR